MDKTRSVRCKPISAFRLAGVKGQPLAPDSFILGLIKKALKGERR